ncbi:MAG: hypothetical protein Q8Q09_04430 [Deltaproteobacteria bacterium]|nr:hypothetical protein [Deltaproteobacteria bacterium]
MNSPHRALHCLRCGAPAQWLSHDDSTPHCATCAYEPPRDVRPSPPVPTANTYPVIALLASLVFSVACMGHLTATQARLTERVDALVHEVRMTARAARARSHPATSPLVAQQVSTIATPVRTPVAQLHAISPRGIVVTAAMLQLFPMRISLRVGDIIERINGRAVGELSATNDPTYHPLRRPRTVLFEGTREGQWFAVRVSTPAMHARRAHSLTM